LSQSKNKQYFDSLFDTNFVAYNCYTGWSFYLS
jgi:hypothetical protein